MREDMFKVIINRPRWASRHAPRSKTRYDKCPDRQRVTGRRMMLEANYTKHLNENLAPLKRYLHKQKGRKWNDVFSEICEHLDTGSTVKMHVREHVEDFIYIKVKISPRGMLYSNTKWGGLVELKNWFAELYVDPIDGTIKETREACRKFGVTFRRDFYKNERRKAFNQKHPFIIHLDGFKWRVRLEEIWYEIELSGRPISESGYEIGLDELYTSLQTHNWRRQDGFKVKTKRQLSKKELKQAKLSNA